MKRLFRNLVKEFHPLRKGNKTKSGVYLVLIGMALEYLGISQADWAGFAGAAFVLIGLGHDGLGKVKKARNGIF